MVLLRLPVVLLLLALGAEGAASGAAPAAMYQVGDTLAPFTTQDQHGQTYRYEPGAARLVVVAFAMKAGKAANAFFEKQPAAFLDEHRAIFLSNIHGMPGIARTFALPKMRKYPHRILLADTEDFLARYPQKEGALTVLALDEAGRITSIDQIDAQAGLSSVFRRK